MNLYHDFGGWTLVFAVLIYAVICDAFGISMGWFSSYRNSAMRCWPLPVG